MRGYSWGNMYLSSIQQGIQGWHDQNEIFTKYKINSPEMLKWLIQKGADPAQKNAQEKPHRTESNWG